MEAKQLMDHSNLIKEKSHFAQNMLAQQKKVDQIDPIFCKAYGVSFHAERGKEVEIDPIKTVQLDTEFLEYWDKRPKTPEKEKQRRKEEEGEESSEDAAAYKIKQRKLAKTQAKDEKLAMIERDNLKVKSIAKYKLIKDGDM